MTKLIAWGQRVSRAPVPQPPGNTLRLIDAAYELGYDGVELDVQLSRDGVLVLIHNHTLDDTAEVQGAVAGFSAAELRSIRLKDKWGGPPAYIESLEDAMRRNGRRGPIMVDSYHTSVATVTACSRAVEKSGFDSAALLLLTYSKEGGALLKKTFPEATVLLKAPHDMFPPKLSLDFISEAGGVDGVLLPIANYPDAVVAFREATERVGLKLAVYLHTSSAEALSRLITDNVDYVTSDAPDVFKDARDMALRRANNLAGPQRLRVE